MTYKFGFLVFEGTKTEIAAALDSHLKHCELRYDCSSHKFWLASASYAPYGDQPLYMDEIKDIIINRELRKLKEYKAGSVCFNAKVFTGSWDEVQQALVTYLDSLRMYCRADGLCSLGGTDLLLKRGLSLSYIRDRLVEKIVETCKESYDRP